MNLRKSSLVHHIYSKHTHIVEFELAQRGYTATTHILTTRTRDLDFDRARRNDRVLKEVHRENN